MTLLDDLARYTPPPPSLRSARQTATRRAGLADEIAALLRAGPKATFELAEALDHNMGAVHRACYGMRLRGLIRQAGTAKRGVTRNRPAYVWKLA